jgi:hypothetical protein
VVGVSCERIRSGCGAMSSFAYRRIVSASNLAQRRSCAGQQNQLANVRFGLEEQTLSRVHPMSVIPPKADMQGCCDRISRRWLEGL